MERLVPSNACADIESLALITVNRTMSRVNEDNTEYISSTQSGFYEPCLIMSGNGESTGGGDTVSISLRMEWCSRGIGESGGERDIE